MVPAAFSSVYCSSFWHGSCRDAETCSEIRRRCAADVRERWARGRCSDPSSALSSSSDPIDPVQAPSGNRGASRQDVWGFACGSRRTVLLHSAVGGVLCSQRGALASRPSGEGDPAAAAVWWWYCIALALVCTGAAPLSHLRSRRRPGHHAR